MIIGTNYYVRPGGACEHQCSSWVHLGKSSVGWRFLHRAYPQPEWAGPDAVTWPVVDRASWLRLLDLGEIFDEYGEQQDRDEFVAFLDRKQDDKPHRGADRDYVVGGFDFCDKEFS